MPYINSYCVGFKFSAMTLETYPTIQYWSTSQVRWYQTAKLMINSSITWINCYVDSIDIIFTIGSFKLVQTQRILLKMEEQVIYFRSVITSLIDFEVFLTFMIFRTLGNNDFINNTALYGGSVYSENIALTIEVKMVYIHHLLFL